VPAVIANDARLIDVSWHNDSAPSFTDARMDQDYDYPRLWVEHPDTNLRECGPGARYVVSGPIKGGDDIGNVWEGDDPAAAVAALLAVIDTCPHPPEAYRFQRFSRNACESCSRCGFVITPCTECPHDEADRLIEATANNVTVTCRACGDVLQA